MTETKKPLTARDINEQAVKAMGDEGVDWYMGWCRPMHEFKTHALLHEKDFDVYLPVEQVRRTIAAYRNAPRSKRYRWLDKAALSGTMFFGMDRQYPRWMDLREEPQVLTRVLCQDGRPYAISGKRMARFVSDNAERFGIREKGKSKFKVGDRVEVIDHALTIESAIHSIQGNKAKLTVEFFGSEHLVEISLDNLRNIEDI